MKAVVIYKTKYGSTRTYAEWIAEELNCDIMDAKAVKLDDLLEYDTIIYGGGLYAEVINGVHTIVKNLDKLGGKRIAVYTTGLTPIDCREYYDGMVMERNFKNGVADNIRVFNFPGKMIIDELSFVHKTAIKSLKKMMSAKENPTEMEQLLIKLCEADGDFTDRSAITELVEYVKE